MADLDRLLKDDISRAAAEAVVPPDFAAIEHRGAKRRRNLALMLVAASAVAIASAAVGSALVLGAESTSSPPVSPGPPARTVSALPSGEGAADQTIEPGTYRVPRSPWSAAGFTITFPKGWTVQYGNIYHHGSEEQLSLEPAVVDEVFTDACHGKRVPEAVGPRVQDLVKALRRQPGPVTSRPVTTSLGGYPAIRIDLRVPKGLDLESCRLARDGGLALQIWYSKPADNHFVLFPGAVASVYILDVGSERQVFVAQNRSPDSRAATTELESVLSSIRVQP